MKYRPHLRSFDESLTKVFEFSTKEELVDHLNEDLEPWGFTISNKDIKAEPYGYDNRVDWDTHLVLMKNQQGSFGNSYFAMEPDYYGAIGYTNGPLE